ncbi:MAG TPA: hypothetical protein PK916_17360 [Bacteroidota bacterium]|nr:hypothetical protein [Bacteroidota bacterium]
MTAYLADLDAVLFIVQVFCTFTLTGLIWFVQLVHYPLLRVIPRQRFVRYERMHVLLTGFVVGPPMLLELLAVLYGLWRTPPWMTQDASQLGAVLLALIWLSTFALQAPLHRRLQKGFDPAAYRRLLYSNWIRSYAWSFRSIILLFSLLHQFVRG